MKSFENAVGQGHSFILPLSFFSSSLPFDKGSRTKGKKEMDPAIFFAVLTSSGPRSKEKANLIKELRLERARGKEGGRLARG